MSKKLYKGIIITLLAISLVLTIISAVSETFCDWYAVHILPIWVNSYGRLSDLFVFSIGEVLFTLGLLLVLISLILAIIMLFLRKHSRYVCFCSHYYRVFAMILSIVILIMTLNCTILYNCTPIDSNYEYQKRDYTVDELCCLRNYVVEKCNAYSLLMERDEAGLIVYNGSLQDEAETALHNISKDYQRLSGYYPDVKKMNYSNILSQASIGGYYFPFSLEANVNSNMYITNYPSTYCHELSHLHGFIYEDEANYISFLACISSEDVFFQYSGYLSVLYYIDNDYFESINYNTEVYLNQPEISEQVRSDNVFLLPEVVEEIESKAVFSTDSVDKVSDKITDTSLKIYGIEDGIASYGRVVSLILQYYDGKLY